ncbi:hypothetical protein [Flavobacterium sp.]|uniref:hypothetical protein n=1 Tax=Flavobacterium sp. TaxID=239 RepID=UPI00120AF33E|nr:hypothetical protein [Flavobacterium sp.]RZJ73317.1 MAG: hypothetical protein EOO49_03130 [Flavobacterium sp.]
MKFTRELLNGFIIFAGIGIYFVILELLGFSDVFWLRILNILFVAYGVNRTIQGNFNEGIRGYNTNLLSAVVTSMIGAALSIASLLAYITFKGGEPYLKNLADNFIFGGGDLTIQQYCIGLLFESSAASLVVSFCLMQYWKDKVEVINRVD